VRIERLPAAELDVVRPAWLALLDHLLALDPGMGPMRPRSQAWARRRASYEDWLADPRAAAFVARDDDGGLLGYAVLRAHAPWSVRETGDGLVELETLSVLPQARGRGVGTALWERVAAHAGRAGVLVGVLTANTGALRLYERLGFRPFTSTWWAMPVPATPAPDAVAITHVPVAGIDDLAPLFAALSDRHAAVGPAYLPPRRDPQVVWPLVRAEHLAGDPVLLRAGADGYVWATITGEGEEPWTARPVGHVEELVVRDGARGGGLGAALLHAAHAALRERGCEAVELEVLEGNADAARFYAREGDHRVFESLYLQLDA
jgi:ribosomal protein S18 acetylase RimI-like enzyme